MQTIMSGLFNSTKLKNCNFFSLRNWKFIWNTFKAGGGDVVVFGHCLFVDYLSMLQYDIVLQCVYIIEYFELFMYFCSLCY